MTALLNAAFRSDWHFSFPDFYLTLCRPFLSGEAIVFTSNVVWLGVQCIDRTSVVKFYHIRFRWMFEPTIWHVSSIFYSFIGNDILEWINWLRCLSAPENNLFYLQECFFQLLSYWLFIQYFLLLPASSAYIFTRLKARATDTRGRIIFIQRLCSTLTIGLPQSNDLARCYP